MEEAVGTRGEQKGIKRGREKVPAREKDGGEGTRCDEGLRRETKRIPLVQGAEVDEEECAGKKAI